MPGILNTLITKNLPVFILTLISSSTWQIYGSVTLTTKQTHVSQFSEDGRWCSMFQGLNVWNHIFCLANQIWSLLKQQASIVGVWLTIIIILVGVTESKIIGFCLPFFIIKSQWWNGCIIPCCRTRLRDPFHIMIQNKIWIFKRKLSLSHLRGMVILAQQ